MEEEEEEEEEKVISFIEGTCKSFQDKSMEPECGYTSSAFLSFSLMLSPLVPHCGLRY